MVAVAGIPMDSFLAGSFSGAVAFSISAKPRFNRIQCFQADGWEVELKKESDFVVARTNQNVEDMALIDKAILFVHRTLDLVSVEDGNHLATKLPADDNILLRFVGGRRLVRIQSIGNASLSINFVFSNLSGSGAVEAFPSHRYLDWVPAFRFYRLSQNNNDLFDAYRNMYLGLESLLDQLFPKDKNEGEKAWLQRAVASVGTKVDLGRLVRTGVPNPSADLVERIYGTRLQLFHAKIGRSLIPDDRVSYLAVAESYPVLLSLWMGIVRDWLSLHRGGSGITYQGFRAMIEQAYAMSNVGITADDSPPDKSETSPSPKGFPTFVFTEAAQVTELQPGRMSLRSRTEVLSLPAGQIVGRVLTLSPDRVPLTISHINGALTLNGADVLETITVLRLVNQDQPKVEFY